MIAAYHLGLRVPKPGSARKSENPNRAPKGFRGANLAHHNFWLMLEIEEAARASSLTTRNSFPCLLGEAILHELLIADTMKKKKTRFGFGSGARLAAWHKEHVDEFLKANPRFRLIRHSRIHWSFIRGSERFDFWPTTGTWLHIGQLKGQGWGSLKNRMLTPARSVVITPPKPADLDPETPPW